MKKISLLLVTVFFLTACSNNEKPGDDHNHNMETTSSVKNPNGHNDPVCGMPEGKEPYTEFTVAGSDTTWFCSPHCKEVFDKNPAKYAAK